MGSFITRLLQLIRFKRPIGTMLLYWPCLWGLYGAKDPSDPLPWAETGLFLLGAFAMRSAGVIINDWLDQDIDRIAVRTKNRPLAAGTLSGRAAFASMVVFLLMGLIVLLQFNGQVIGWGIASLVFVPIYPLLKRWTHWPQLFLGCAFNWGVWMGGAVYDRITLTHLCLYGAGIAWTVGYDTIYALQDRPCDQALNLKSTALYFGDQVRGWVGFFYGLALLGFLMALWSMGVTPYRLVLWFGISCLLGFQVVRLQTQQETLRQNDVLFRWNNLVGLLVALLCLG